MHPQQTPNGAATEPAREPPGGGSSSSTITGSITGKGAGTASGSGTHTGGGTGTGTDSQKSFMRNWLEPPVQVKPSYQEAGLVRHGVVENMAALGTLPKVGVFKKAAPPPPPEQPAYTRRIVLKRPAAPATPTPAPAAAPAPVAPTPEEDETEEEEEEGENDYGSHVDGDGGAEDDDMTPAHASAPSRRSLPSRGREDEWGFGKSVHKGHSGRSLSRTSGGGRHASLSSLRQPSTTASSRFSDSRELTDKVVEEAVDEALAHFRYPTAFALRTLYDENCANPEFVAMIEKVCLQTADADTLKQFTQLVHQKKIEAKVGNKGCHYFVGEPDGNRETPATAAAAKQPKPAPYSNLIRFDVSALHLGRKQRQRSKDRVPKQEFEQDLHQVPAEPVLAEQVPAEQAPEQGSGPGLEHSPEKNPEQEPRQPGPEQDAIQDPVQDPTRAESLPDTAPDPVPDPISDPIIPDHILNKPEPQPDRRPQQKQQQRDEPREQHEEQPVRETHVRKKRKANRHLGSASKRRMTSHGGVNGKAAKTDSPSKRRTRANSMSSTSSLSSARSMTPPDGIEEDDDENENENEGESKGESKSIGQGQGEGEGEGEGEVEDDKDGSNEPPSRASPAVVSRKNAAAPRPIKLRNRSKAAKKNGNVSPAPRSPSLSTTQTPAPAQPPADDAQLPDVQPYDMPAVIDAPLFPNLNAKKGSKSAGVIFPSKVGRIDDDDPRFLLRLNAKKVTARAEAPPPISFTREPPVNDIPVLDFEEDPIATVSAPPSRPRTSLPAGRSTPAPSNARSTRSSRKRSHDELEDPVSPSTFNFPVSEVPSTAANSRAGTPALRAAKKPRVGLRVKTSPMKKKSGPSAGIPRASGERSSPVGNGGGAIAKEDDNDDYCSSCGGNGELICCDGCTRSFHLNCVDPPLIQDSMPVEWYCNVCRTARHPARFPTHAGAFALLLERLDAKNSSAFRLPDDVREYFEAVRTGVDGEYEEVVTVVKPGRKKKSDEETPDFFRTRDNDGNAVICHNCQRASSQDRAIIPCSLCGLWWHLDFLRTWKCPCHVDDLLSKLPGALGPAHRFRKIKGAPVVQPAFSRGYINNGYIEVDLERDEDESGWKNVETYGRTVRLPEKGIKLDFLSRVRENRKGKPIPPLRAGVSSGGAPPVRRPLDKKTLEEQQAAYNLTQLSGQGNTAIANLVDTLLAQADEPVIALMARGNPGHIANGKLNNMDQQSLRAMLAQMEQLSSQARRLLGLASPGQPHQQAAGDGPAQDQMAPVPNLANSQSTNIDSENITNHTPEPCRSGSDAKKDLPSPAATEDVPPTMPAEDKSLPGMDGDRITASTDEKVQTDSTRLPTTPAKKPVGAHDMNDCPVLEPQSDKTAVEENDIMDIKED
ncbi:hypothetical protein B0T22DRAFT_495795 [Podospora appendiculata]|uniref:PHD-type domain-containing protein n=1 Tax=Podospora appendiculata TaxID=314037 RepID=A0AAE0XG93_9PEZI|nr:hypothetical protein B0T22DRAFT_495795 [Podospora appendiculata]